MPDIATTLGILHQLWERAGKAEADRVELMKSNMPAAWKDEQDKLAQQQVALLHRYEERQLNDLVHFPPHAVEHFADVDQFHQGSPYEKSVFLMTKFPDSKSPLDVQLTRVITAVTNAVTKAGFVPHLASEKTYNPMLWKNVEVYLLACSRGIAIVESKHTAELNPNVTMEWGWMRAMDRPVLFLVEKSFDKSRADLSGLINDPFDWDNPEAEIEAAVSKFLI